MFNPLSSLLFLFFDLFIKTIFDFADFLFKLGIIISFFDGKFVDVGFEFLYFLKKELGFFMVKGLDVGKFTIENVKMLFKILLSKVFFAIELVLDLLPTIVE